MSLITTLLSVFGSGLGSLFSWLVQWFETKLAQKQAAINNMDADMSAHAGDGALSVSDMQSAQAQIDDINNQLNQLDQQQPVSKGNNP